mmetsp:Transcript_10702/g.23815  ORF Transcript_10702/g.23815 Transcript_10702/m.23815 type:complete len:447 (-) Transcript_10702:275-1615(-)
MNVFIVRGPTTSVVVVVIVVVVVVIVDTSCGGWSIVHGTSLLLWLWLFLSLRHFQGIGAIAAHASHALQVFHSPRCNPKGWKAATAGCCRRSGCCCRRTGVGTRYPSGSCRGGSKRGSSDGGGCPGGRGRKLRQELQAAQKLQWIAFAYTRAICRCCCCRGGGGAACSSSRIELSPVIGAAMNGSRAIFVRMVVVQKGVPTNGAGNILLEPFRDAVAMKNVLALWIGRPGNHVSLIIRVEAHNARALVVGFFVNIIVVLVLLVVVLVHWILLVVGLVVIVNRCSRFIIGRSFVGCCCCCYYQGRFIHIGLGDKSFLNVPMSLFASDAVLQRVGGGGNSSIVAAAANQNFQEQGSQSNGLCIARNGLLQESVNGLFQLSAAVVTVVLEWFGNGRVAVIVMVVMVVTMMMIDSQSKGSQSTPRRVNVVIVVVVIRGVVATVAPSSSVR